MIIDKLKTALQSKLVVPYVFLFGLFFWLLDLNSLVVCALVLLVAVILLVCDDVKNIFCPVIYAGFFIKDILASANWVVYVACAVVALAAFVTFTVRKIREKGKTLKFGKVFFPLLVFDVGFLLGGIIGNFNILAFAATFGLCAVMLLLYFIAINFTDGIDEYLPFLFTCGAAFISVQICLNSVIHSGDLTKIFAYEYAKGSWASAEGPNTSAMFIGLGVVSALFYALKGKNGYLMIIPSCFYLFMIGVVCCRGMLLTMAIVFPAEVIYVIVKSKEKNKIIITFAVILIAVFAVNIITGDISGVFKEIVRRFTQDSSNGRLGEGGIWHWCLEKFKKYPVFGYGFISKEPVPAIRTGTQYFILAHNTAIQWIASIGIVGILLSVWFYATKYTLIFKDADGSVLLSALIIVVALSGVTEQAAAMDPFAFMLPILLLAGKEFSIEKKVKKESCADGAEQVGESA